MVEIGEGLLKLGAYDGVTIRNVKVIEGHWRGEDVYDPPFAVLDLTPPQKSNVGEECITGEDRRFIADVFGADPADVDVSVEPESLSVFVHLPHLKNVDEGWLRYEDEVEGEEDLKDRYEKVFDMLYSRHELVPLAVEKKPADRCMDLVFEYRAVAGRPPNFEKIRDDLREWYGLDDDTIVGIKEKNNLTEPIPV